MQNLSGQNIKGYDLHEQIGAGGFGAVYRAYQTTVGREVAIKIILPSFANQQDFIRRFESEAQVIARLEHMHITPLYDYWRDPSGAYIVMRFFRGGSLKDALATAPFDLGPAALLLDQIASALALAHRNQVIHRDLKPANILMDEDGNAYLADFGIAKVLGDLTGDLTQPDTVVGSLDYISPEQARGEPVTACSDIYSLGVVVYEMLRGCHPFQDITPVERLYRHLNDPLPPLLSLEDTVCEAVNAVIQKATAKKPSERYADVLALATAFRAAAGMSHPPAGESIVETLTAREQEILHHIVRGLSNSEIARTLFMTVGTVKWYTNQIYRKLGVRSRIQAIVRARELNLVFGSSAEPQHTGAATASILLPEPENPYKGLRPFQTADYRHFFGREALVEKLVQRLVEKDGALTDRFLAVIGPSGSGKSSLVKAGLIPALWRGDLVGSERWFVVEMLPGSRPLEELEIALMRVAADQSANLMEQLQRDARGLLRVARLILPDDQSELVIVIDQFEELFTLVEDEAVRAHFLDLLYTASTDPRSRVRIVITLRADFYDRPLRYPDFGELIRSRMETVLPLSAEGLERAIVRPAELVGVTFEEGLVAIMIDEVNYQPGALPLLQYALTELFERRSQRTLRRQAYEEIGGTIGALARRADEIFHDLSPEGQASARQMFLRLVTLGEGVEDTRRRVPRSELMAIAGDHDIMDEIIDAYATYRLLSLDHDPATRAPMVELAHEAILREWERLRIWLDQSREGVRLQRQLAAAAHEWHAADRDTSFLLRGARLAQLETWSVDTDLTLTPQERCFLDASLAEREREVKAERERQAHEVALEQRAARWLRIVVGVLVAALVIVSGLAAVAISLGQQAEQQRHIAVSRELAASAVSNLEIDPERSVLLALSALSESRTLEAENALHHALPALHILGTLSGHTANVHDIAYSSDGVRLASASYDGSARVWDTASREVILSLDNIHGGNVFGVAFSPDGTRLATTGADGMARIWDAATGQELLALRASDTSTRDNWFLGGISLAFSSDGTRLATGGADGSIRIWDAESGEGLLALRGDELDIVGVAFNPDGTRLATVSYNSAEAKVWDAETGEVLLTLCCHSSPGATGVAFSPDGSLLATSGVDGTAKVWDADAGEEVLTLWGHNGIVDGVTFSPDGTLLATASYDGTGKLWEVATGRELLTLAGHKGNLQEIAFSPDGRQVATSSADWTIKVWDIAPGREVATLISHGWSVGLSSDGSRLVTGGVDGSVTVWDSASGETLHTLQGYCEEVASRATFGPDGRMVAAGCRDGTATLWDAQTGTLLHLLDGHDAWTFDVAFSPDASRLATASQNGTAKVWDTATGQELLTLKGHGDALFGVAFSPDGAQLATASQDGTVRLWDAGSGREEASWSVPEMACAVAYSPDGSRLALGLATGTVKVFEMPSGRELLALVGHNAMVIDVAFSPDGMRLASASFDGTTKIWDAASGEEQATLYGHSNSVMNVSFTADGTQAVTASLDGTVRFFVLNLEDLVALAQARVTRTLTEQECRQFLHLEQCPAP